MTVHLVHPPDYFRCEICGRRAYAKINGIAVCGDHPAIEARLLRLQEIRDTGKEVNTQGREGL